MANIFFPYTILTRIYANETALAEAVSFAEVSRFGKDAERVVADVRSNLEKLLREEVSAPELHSRILPKELNLREFALSIAPPRNSKAWREPLEIKFFILESQRADGFKVGFVPQLQISVLSKDGAKFDDLVRKEILAALQREGATKSLENLRRFMREQTVKITNDELSINIPSPKQRTIDEETDDEKDKKTTLEEVGTDLTKEILRPAYEVEKYVAQLAEILHGKQARSILLVGASGVGKTAIFQELVRRREELGFEKIPFWATSGARLVAGQSGFGMWQERCQKLTLEAKKENAILHLGNLVELLEVGKSMSNSNGIASFFRPKIARGEIVVVVEATTEQLPFIERQDANLLSVFRQIPIEEPSKEKVFEILQKVAEEI